MTTHPVAPPVDGSHAVRQDLRSLEKVRGIFASLAKFVNAQAIYQTNNPSYIKTAQGFEQSFRSYFETEAELLLTVSQYQLHWREQVVYDIGCNTESIAFLLYKDGIGEISIQAAVGRAELERFTGILKGALYNPSAQFDTASALWQAEFPNIFYRVLDEQTDHGSGDGDGTGNTNREQPLRANDHQDLVAGESSPRQRSDSGLDTLGAYFNAAVDREHPGLDAMARESCVATNPRRSRGAAPARAGWVDRFSACGHEGDELIAFLRVMLEFTSLRCAPSVARDVHDTIERLAHFIRDEGDIAALNATLELTGGVDAAALEPGFAALLERIEDDLTHPGYLLSLARGLRGGNTPEDLLRYLSLAGENAVAGLCELLARTSDDAIHEKGCDILHGIAGDNLLTIVEQLDVSNPLLRRRRPPPEPVGTRGSIPAVVQRILASTGSRDSTLRHRLPGQQGSDEAARLLCGLFKDGNQAVRIRAFALTGRAQASAHRERTDVVVLRRADMLKSSEELEAHVSRSRQGGGGCRAAPPSPGDREEAPPPLRQGAKQARQDPCADRAALHTG